MSYNTGKTYNIIKNSVKNDFIADEMFLSKSIAEGLRTTIKSTID